MECYLGRKLERNEVVRHRDKDLRNNLIENLYVITRQQQFKEQLANGNVAQSILDGIKRKENGIKKKRKRYPKNKTGNPIGRPKGICTVKTIKAIETPNRKASVYETKKIDRSSLIPFKVNNKTTVYIDKNTTNQEKERLKQKYS